MKKIIFVFLTVILGSGAYFFLKNYLPANNKDHNSSTVSSVSPTPTPVGGDVNFSPSDPALNKCNGLSGKLEMQILVGPAEAVGMSPVTVGDIPFTVVKTEDVYLVEGEGLVSYQETMGEVWGTYSVSLEMDSTVEGVCVGDSGNEQLNVTVVGTGEQMVEVRADDFQGDYPWSGTRTLDLSFPLADGAQVEGEGWLFILHLSE
jgi:hypothetical protein